MKNIKLLIPLVLINFYGYSQTIPTPDEFLNFLQENNSKCGSIDYEELYSNFGYDVEDDVSELRDAIDDFCECFLPSYFEEYNLISSKKNSLIKHFKDNGFEDFQYTSLFTIETFKDAGLIPDELKFEPFPEKIMIDFKLYGLNSNIVEDTTIYPLQKAKGLDVPGYSVSQEHDFGKSLDDFKAGDKTKSKIWIDSNDDLIKNSYYEIVYEKVDDERIWSITEFKKEVNCRYSKNNCGECEDKVDKSINTIIEYIGSWDRIISKEKIDWDWSTWGLEFGFRSKYLIANTVFNENLISFLERIFDTKVFLSGPHDKGMNFNYSNDFGRYNPEFIKKLIITAEEILSNPVYLNLIRPIFKNHLEDMAITYQATSELFKVYKKYFQGYLNETTKIYLESLKTGYFPINQYSSFEDKFGVETIFGSDIFESDASEEAGIKIPDYDYNIMRRGYFNYYTALNFWGRRNIDGTNELFSKLLDLVIEKIYDYKFDISGTKFKRGQYKVLLKEIDEKAAAGNQDIDKNNFINNTEIILNISDNINGKYEFSSWGYDGRQCSFSRGIKDENTVKFSLKCSSEGDTYDAGSYTIEIIDESTLRWKSDDGRYEKVFNYTFIPEE